MIVIPKKLKTLVEQYIISSDRTKELGGYFFGSESKFQAFLPSPNYSETPRNTFRHAKSGKNFAKEFGVMLDMPIVACLHTHPNGSVVSEADTKYLRTHDYTYEVVIADQGEKFRWFVVNRELQEIGFIKSDEELEKLAFIFALEMGLKDLGRVFMSNDNTLLTTTALGRSLLSIDEDAYKLYNLLKDIKRRYSFPRKTVMQQKTGLSASRVNKAIDKLDKEGLLPK